MQVLSAENEVASVTCLGGRTTPDNDLELKKNGLIGHYTAILNEIYFGYGYDSAIYLCRPSDYVHRTDIRGNDNVRTVI